MSEIVEEQLSAFLDDALPEGEEELLLRRLERSYAHRDTLMRYGLIGDLLRGESTGEALVDLSGVISSAVANTDDAAPPRARRSILKIGGWAAGIAVGLAALLAINLDLTVQDTQVAERSDVQLVLTPEAQPMSNEAYSVRGTSPRSPLAPSRMASYLVSHGDYTRGLSRQMMNSHVVNQRPELMRASFSQDQ